MKKILFFLLCAVFLTPGVLADEARSYDFELSTNGVQLENAAPGDILTFTLTLHRTDSDEAALMYAMQDEISYDSDFFRLVEGGSLMRSGVELTDISIQGRERRLYISFVSFTGGELWEADTLVGTFQMEVVGTEGSSRLRQEALVSNRDGTGSYTSTRQDASTVISPEKTAEAAELTEAAGATLSAETTEPTGVTGPTAPAERSDRGNPLLLPLILSSVLVVVLFLLLLFTRRRRNK